VASQVSKIDMVRGWGVLMGVPALFCAAYVIGLFPTIADLPVCAARSFLGVECPGCGLTHSFAALVHGGVRASIDFHPLGPVIALWLLILFGRELARVALCREIAPLLHQRSRDLIVAACLVGFALQWIVKLALR
jgi:hypothetical protein